LFSPVLLASDLIREPGMQYSGGLGTAELNCIRNILMQMYAFYADEKNRNYVFFDEVRPATYGDDLISALSDRIKENFNASVYQKFCKDHYRMEFTDPDKNNEIKPYIPIEKGSFLKRHFSDHPILNRKVMVLELSSIRKTMMWHIPSPCLSSYHHMLDSVRSCLFELYLHIGHSFDVIGFENMRNNLINIMSTKWNVDINHVSKVLPSLDSLTEHFSVGEDLN
jgi:hypothetical protein